MRSRGPCTAMAPVRQAQGRAHEARLFYDESLALASVHAPRYEPTVVNNVAMVLVLHDLPGAEAQARAAVALVRRRAMRAHHAGVVDTLMLPLMAEGRCAEAAALATDVRARRRGWRCTGRGP